MTKCAWALNSPPEERYHDLEWGQPIHEDQLLFEFLVLEGAQAGLSWVTVLKKREAYRIAFDHFDVERIACYDEQKVTELMANPNIIRNRLKIHSAINNAKAFLTIQQAFGSFDAYIWQFVNGKPRQNTWQRHQELPASTALSDLISKDLKQRGFSFIGSTICYAYMQAIGMVNDHTVDCYRHAELYSSSLSL